MNARALHSAAPAGVRLALLFAARELRGGLRGFYVFAACVGLGVMAIAGVGSVASSLTDGLAREGRVILGGDVSFSLSLREASADERLAPVTPLRRSRSETSSRRDLDRSAESHPSRAASRPVADLPVRDGDARRGGARGGASRGGEARGDAEAEGAEWNNTWGAQAATVDEVEPVDDETERQSRRATGLTIRQLARRGMSRWELEQLLTRREIEPEVFGPELDRLEAMGVVDDASLAASLAFTQHSRKGLGRTAIEQELKRRHIDPELIELALADIADEDELARATELAVKRAGQLSSYDDETARRRLHGFLARKGYASDVIRQAMEAALASRRTRSSGVRFQ